jgi:hypothetical protein
MRPSGNMTLALSSATANEFHKEISRQTDNQENLRNKVTKHALQIRSKSHKTGGST